jgi:hypothetical protein
MQLRQLLALLLAGAAVASGQIVIDGDESEWTGSAPGAVDTWVYSYKSAGTTNKINEWIWQDESLDFRTDLSPSLHDILQIRLASDGTNLYYCCTLPPNQSWSPAVMLQITIRRAGSTSTQRFLAGFADTMVPDSAAWDYLILTPGGSGGSVNKVYAPDFSLVSVGSYAQGAVAGTLEGAVPWSSLGGVPGASSMLFTFSIYGADGSDNTINLAGSASNCLDFVTTTPGQTWNVVQSGSLNYAARIQFVGNDEVLPIQLAGFTAVPISADRVRLEWSTLSEVNNYGFYVERRSYRTGDFQMLPGSFLSGRGTSTSPCHYAYTDENASRGEWEYRLRQVDLDGTIWFSEAIRVEVHTGVSVSTPAAFVLMQNFPNPFNPSTTIRYGLSRRSQVTLSVMNALGQQVATIVQGEQEAGYHEVKFDASNLASGVYFYRIQAGEYVQTNRLLYLR